MTPVPDAEQLDADVLDSAALAARIACEEVSLAFLRHIDRGEATRALGLFTDDGVFEVRGERLAGRDALARFLTAREAATDRHTRHLASNFHFTLESPSLARATAHLTLFTAVGQVLKLDAVIDCELTFVRPDRGRWLMAERRHVRFASSAD